MNNRQTEQIEELLTRTAIKVRGLLIIEAYRKKFDQYRQAFYKKQIAYIESETLHHQQKDKYRKQAAKDKRLRDKKGGPPKVGYVWYDDSPCEDSDVSYEDQTPENGYVLHGAPPKEGGSNLGFWGPPRKNSVPSPEWLLMPFAYSGRLPNNRAEQLERHYILLLIIYDWKLPECRLANENTLDGLACILGLYDADNKQGLIETAFNDVKADLEGPPKEGRCEHSYEIVIGKGICSIAKCAKLLIALEADNNRTRDGVPCEDRTYKTFREKFLLTIKREDVLGKFFHKNGRIHTTIERGKLSILVKK